MTPAGTDASPISAAKEALVSTFGFPAFREGQEAIIDAMLAGQDVLAIMPTGGGKSLCYQLPAVVGSGVTLVISPLIALMKDQVDAMNAIGVSAAFVNSSLSFDRVREVMDDVKSGTTRLLYVAPERFYSQFFMAAMSGISIDRIAVDEAHCVSQWGHDFRPAYVRLQEAVEKLGRPPVSAFTATATPDVQDDISALLGLRDPQRFVTGFDRENLFLEVKSGGKKRDMLADFISQHSAPGIVYAATRKKVDDAHAQLRSAGLSAVAYHAGMPDEARVAAQNAFINGTADVIVATNAFGMGIDKANVRFVVHYDMPGTVEAYYQEAGRAGRDGKPATCTVLYGAGDRFTQEFFIDSSNPTEALIRRLWAVLVDARDEYDVEFGDEGTVELSYRELGSRIGEKSSDMAISSALKELEQASALVRLNPRTNPATVRVRDRTQVSARAQVQVKILEAIDFHLPQGEGGSLTIPLPDLAHTAGIDHDALLRGLHAMATANAIDYTPPFKGRGLRLLAHELPPIDFSVIEAKRSHAMAGLDAMERYCRAPGCRRAAILAHFGEIREQGCGTCDGCLAPTSGADAPAPATELARKLLSGVARCRIGGGSISFGIQTVAAHLAGGNTEQVRRNKLDQISTYALLAEYTQKQVAELLEQLLMLGLLSRTDVGEAAARRPVLALTEQGLAVLKGAGEVLLRRPGLKPESTSIRASGRASSGATSKRAARPTADLPAEDENLFASLRALRYKLAQEEDVPAFRVFTDRALVEMARFKPTSLSAMEEINGVGPKKLEIYGETFIRAIREGA